MKREKLILIQCFLLYRLIALNSLNPHSLKYLLQLSPLYRWRNWCPEKWNDFSKMTQLVRAQQGKNLGPECKACPPNCTVKEATLVVLILHWKWLVDRSKALPAKTAFSLLSCLRMITNSPAMSCCFNCHKVVKPSFLCQSNAESFFMCTLQSSLLTWELLTGRNHVF